MLIGKDQMELVFMSIKGATLAQPCVLQKYLLKIDQDLFLFQIGPDLYHHFLIYFAHL